MSIKPDDFKAEVSGGYLLVAIKIPTYTCAGCGAVYTSTVDLEEIRRIHEGGHGFAHAFSPPTPWDSDRAWVSLLVGDDFVRVCADCGEPIKAMRQACAELEAAAKAAIIARIEATKR